MGVPRTSGQALSILIRRPHRIPGTRAGDNAMPQHHRTISRKFSPKGPSHRCRPAPLTRRDVASWRDGPVSDLCPSPRCRSGQGPGSSYEHGRPVHEQFEWALGHVTAGSAAPYEPRPAAIGRDRVWHRGRAAQRRRCDRLRHRPRLRCPQFGDNPSAWPAAFPARSCRYRIAGPPGAARGQGGPARCRSQNGSMT
jgi:hypothetical protein